MPLLRGPHLLRTRPGSRRVRAGSRDTAPARKWCAAPAAADRDDQKAELLYRVLRDAIVRGSKHAGIRFFKNKGEGLMTQIDKERGWSYESHYTILGLVTWQELHAQKLPKWALPVGYRDFSLDNLPMSPSDLDGQLD